MSLKGLKDMSIDPADVKVKSKEPETTETKLKREKKSKNPNRISRHKGHRTKGPVCMTDGKKYLKVDRDLSSKMVKEGWRYCNRTEYKKATR